MAQREEEALALSGEVEKLKRENAELRHRASDSERASRAKLDQAADRIRRCVSLFCYLLIALALL